MAAARAGDGMLRDCPAARGGLLCSQRVECLVQGDVATSHEDTLRLFDDDATLQSGVRLFVHGVLLTDAAGLDQADGGGVGERLGEGEVVGVQWPVRCVQQQEAADDVLAKAHRQGAGLCRREPGWDRKTIPPRPRACAQATPTPGALPRSPSYGGCPEGRGPWSPYPHRLRRCFGCGAASGVAPRAPTAPSQLSDGRPAREPISGTCPSSWSERTRSTLARTPDGRARGAVQCSARPAALPTRSGRRYEDPLVASWPCAAGGLDLPCAAAILLGARSAPSMPDERAGRGLGHSGHRGSWTGLMAVSLAVAVRRAGQCAVRQ